MRYQPQPQKAHRTRTLTRYYSWVKKDGSWVYVKLYAESMQGVKNSTNTEAADIAGQSSFIQIFVRVLMARIIGTNPDFATQDLWESIQNRTYPGWTLYAQVLDPQDAQNFKYNVLDLTKCVR